MESLFYVKKFFERDIKYGVKLDTGLLSPAIFGTQTIPVIISIFKNIRKEIKILHAIYTIYYKINETRQNILKSLYNFKYMIAVIYIKSCKVFVIESLCGL